MRIGIDIGGTFTDFVAYDQESEELFAHKLLSTPSHPERAVLSGLARLIPKDSTVIIHGSTVATNALLERKGAKTALITTGGFEDLLTIGRQQREQIYDFSSDRPEPLIPSRLCFGVTERATARDGIHQRLDLTEVDGVMQAMRDHGVESVAISLLFSFLHPEHEGAIARSLEGSGLYISCSHQILPEFREYERTSTTAVNAYVGPIVEGYLSRLKDGLGEASLQIMQSNGGILSASSAGQQAVRTILSGPAGGVVGAAYMAKQVGIRRLISFDMGGTSTDVSLVDGDFQITTEAAIDGLPIRVPVMDIHTVGSGGGSVITLDPGGAMRVGPESAGAIPGPACYDQGGELPTITDANLLLGRLPGGALLGGEIRLSRQRAEASFQPLLKELTFDTDHALTPLQQAALAATRIANARMTRALRVISIERGYDPREFLLVSFGGAGGLHACDLARDLGIRQILIPHNASTLSAFGMLAAPIAKDYVQTVMMPGSTPYKAIDRGFQPLISRARKELAREGVPNDILTLYLDLDMRYQGQSYEIRVPFNQDFRETFHSIHQERYGYRDPQGELEVVNLRVRAQGSPQPLPLPQGNELQGRDPQEALNGRVEVVLSEDELGKGWIESTPFYDGHKLQPGHQVKGAAVILMQFTTVYVPPFATATMDHGYNLRLVIL